MSQKKKKKKKIWFKSNRSDIFFLIKKKKKRQHLVSHACPAGQPAQQQSSSLQNFLQTHPGLTNTERVVLFMTQRNFTLQKLNSLPFGIVLPLLEVIHQCHENPPSNWPEGAYALMGRHDLSAQAKLRENGEQVVQESVSKPKVSWRGEKKDG